MSRGRTSPSTTATERPGAAGPLPPPPVRSDESSRRAGVGTAEPVTPVGQAAEGELRIGWAARSMPVLAGIAERFARERPLDGLRIAACLHVTAETAVLLQVLREGGAEIALAASNPLDRKSVV